MEALAVGLRKASKKIIYGTVGKYQVPGREIKSSRDPYP